MLYLRVHEFEDATRLASLDFERHMQCLPEQQDPLELLEVPQPDPPPPPPSPAPPEAPEPYEPPEPPEPPESEELPTQQAVPVVVGLALPARCLRRHHTLLTDALIFKYVDVHGPKWRELSRSLGGRAFGYGDDVVRNRYIRICEALGVPYQSAHPRSKKTTRKPDRPCERWTEEEDLLIHDGIQEMGLRWDLIAKQFGGRRTTQAVRNRANRLGMCERCHAQSPDSVDDRLE
jgi:hypothetical protein